MKFLSEFITRDYEYTTEEERAYHKKAMIRNGWDQVYDYKTINNDTRWVYCARYERDN